VPVPSVADLDALNVLLLDGCRADEARVLHGRMQSVGTALAWERGHLLSRVAEGFDWADVVFPLVDKQGCVTGEDQLLLRASARGHAGGSAGTSTVCRDLARWAPDCPPRTLSQPPPACARS
jgi:hypothetical protein